MKSLKKRIFPILAALGLMAEVAHASENFIDEIEFEPHFRILMRYNDLDLKESKEIPSLSENEKIKIKAGSGMEFLPIRAGYCAKYYLRNSLYLTAGIDGEINLDKFGDVSHEIRTESFIEQGDSKNNGIYDRVFRELFGLYPFMGLKLKTPNKTLEIEYSFPIHEFKRQWGHYHDGKEEKLGEEHYWPRGFALTLRKTLWSKDRLWRSGLEAGIEKYRLEGERGIMGKQRGITLGLFFERKF